MKTQLNKSADQKIRTKGILCAQMRETKRKNTLDRKSNVEKKNMSQKTMKTQLNKSADQKIRTKGILCAQMRETKRKNTLDRKSNVEKTLILSRVF